MSGHQLAMALRRAYLAIHRQTNDALVPTGVTADQFVVLCELAQGASKTQRELVDRTASDSNTLRAMLVLLERRGLVQRRPHPTDGRAWSVALTAQGRRTFQKLWRRSDKLRMKLVEHLDQDSLRHFIALLSDLVQRLGDGAGKSRRPVGAAAMGIQSSN